MAKAAVSNPFRLTETPMARLRLILPRLHGTPRADGRRVLCGIIFVNRNGLRRRDAPSACGSRKTLHTRWWRWRRKGVFARMLPALARAGRQADLLMLDAKFLEVHRTAASLRACQGLKARRRLIGRSKGGVTSKLHVVADAWG